MTALDQLLATLKAAHERATPGAWTTNTGGRYRDIYVERGALIAADLRERDAALVVLLCHSLPTIIAMGEVCRAAQKLMEPPDGLRSIVLNEALEALARALAGETQQESQRHD